jgi:uncharacterized membrane protein
MYLLPIPFMVAVLGCLVIGSKNSGFPACPALQCCARHTGSNPLTKLSGPARVGREKSTAMLPPASNRFQDNDTARLEAFSDGVFAIDITLLTFELKAPAFHETYTSLTLLPVLLRQWPAYVAFLLSFATIFVIWVNHHRMFNVIHRSDARFLYLNGGLLLLTSVIPFATNISARYIQTSAAELAAAFSMGLFGCITGAFWLMWTHATHDLALLKRPSADIRIHSVRRGLATATGIYAASAVLALWLPYVSLAVGLGMVGFLARQMYHREQTV